MRHTSAPGKCVWWEMWMPASPSRVGKWKADNESCTITVHGKNANVNVLVSQLCPTLCDPMDCSPQGSAVHGILQATILEWVAIPFSRRSSWPRDLSRVSFIAGRFFIVRATGMWETISYFSTMSFIFPYRLKTHLIKVRFETLSCDLGLIPGHNITPATDGVFVRSWPFLKGRAHS